MGETTKIEWADATVNMWWGCTKVSPGCEHCYADSLAHRWGKDVWGPGKPREDHRAGATKLARKLERQAIAEGRTLRVFSASMSDWLDHEVPAEWLADLLELVRTTPALTWMLLSKRPADWKDRIEQALHYALNGDSPEGLATWIGSWLDGQAPKNVWVGTTVEDQQRAEERVPAVLAIPARVRFLSCEPLVGPVILRTGTRHRLGHDGARFIGDVVANAGDFGTTARTIDWVIAGGESGPGARAMDPAWARSLRDQAVEAGVAFHFKQWGEHDATGARVGKHEAGRLLDGRTWDELPT